jgi:hypothetical protein
MLTKKDFEGEEYTISGDYLAYQDMGIPLKIKDFKGVQRDGIPYGNRIFRMPYFDKDGKYDNNAVEHPVIPGSGLPDRSPGDQGGEIHIQNSLRGCTRRDEGQAVLNYQLLVKPVADFLKVPSDESEIMMVNEHSQKLKFFPDNKTLKKFMMKKLLLPGLPYWVQRFYAAHMEQVSAIPAFARKYQISCQVCHTPAAPPEAIRR